MEHYKGRFNRFDSLYLGGGTPTLLDCKALADMMDHLFFHFDFDTNTEITIEANPCDLTREKIKRLIHMGINRISIGVQSFDNRMLSFLGRNHTAVEAQRALSNSRSLGFKNIALDLIYGLEGQSLNEWLDTLKQAVSFHPEHISCYQLTFEKKTLFNRLKDKDLIRLLTEEEECSFFVNTSQFLEDYNYFHYEVSNFAGDEGYCSRHNSKYWHHIPYLGLGPSAHSFNKATRWWNVRSIRKYCERLERGEAPVEGYENLTADQLKLEAVTLGIRTRNGFDLTELACGLRSSGMLKKLQDTGFIEVNDGKVIPTKKGLLVADSLPLYLLRCRRKK